MLAFRVVCWSHQSDLRIRVCIRLLHKNNWITHQSDCRIRVCISHQSYQIIWISCTNHSVWGLYTKNDISWAHLINVMVCGLHEGLVAFNFLYHFNVRTFFSNSFTHNTHAKQLIFHHVPWKQRPKSNHNISNHCTTWTVGNFLHVLMAFQQSNSILPH